MSNHYEVTCHACTSYRLAMNLSRMICTSSLILIILLSLLLTSCSTTHRVIKQDGPPPYYVDETKIPDAVPRPAKLSKYGNYSSYTVFGKRYHTLKSSKNYEAVGVASWYGMLYQSHPTSDGDRYNVVAMTAAHKTLPLPTFVEVTNLKNHRKIIVKVNDRGPFEGNRLIDLSYVAAKKLDMIGTGTALVKIKAIDPFTFGHEKELFVAQRKKSSLTHFANNTSANKHFYLQVGAFKNKQLAERLKRHLLSLYIEPVNISAPTEFSNLYRVQIGPIKNMAEANKITQRLQDVGINIKSLPKIEA